MTLQFWVRHVAATDSTQDHLFRMARAISSPPPTGTVVVADRQTRGRGREGRPWLSPEGGLYCSLLVHEDDITSLGAAVAPRDPQHRVAARDSRSGSASGHAPILKLPLIAGLAVADVVASYGGQAAIKWPNDVILNDRKLAGILCEAKEGRVVIGIGVNLRENPLPIAASLAELSSSEPVSRDAVLERLLAAFAARLGREDTGAEVDARLWKKGERARHGETAIVLQGVSENGALMVATEQGHLEIISGEITFEDAGTEGKTP